MKMADSTATVGLLVKDLIKASNPSPICLNRSSKSSALLAHLARPTMFSSESTHVTCIALEEQSTPMYIGVEDVFSSCANSSLIDTLVCSAAIILLYPLTKFNPIFRHSSQCDDSRYSVISRLIRIQKTPYTGVGYLKLDNIPA